jgi:hypothetical protein
MTSKAISEGSGWGLLMAMLSAIEESKTDSTTE